MNAFSRAASTAIGIWLVLASYSGAFAGARQAATSSRDERARFTPRARAYRGIPDFGDVVRLRELPPPVAADVIQGPQGPSAVPSGTSSCSFGAVTGLSAAQTVAYLKSHDVACLGFLWTSDASLAEVFTQEKMLAVLAAVAQASPAYDAARDDSGHLLELLTFVRIGFFHEYYDGPVAFDHAAIREAAIGALRSVEQTSALLAPLYENEWTTDAERILNEWVVTVDTVSDILPDFYSTFEDIVAFFGGDELILARLEQRPWQGYVIHSTLYALQRSLWRVEVQQATQPRLVQELERLALVRPLVDDHVWLLNSAIWTLHHVVLGLGGELRLEALAAVEQVFLAYDFDDELEVEPHLWAIQALPMGGGGCYAFIDGSHRVCRDEIAARIRAELFPFHHVLHDGALVVETPLGRSTARMLGTATAQVKQQFVSISGYAEPRPEDTNDTLTMVVYGSKRDYEVFQPFLTGLGTNNGGIYIESIGTFYTYQREASESIYTLEDLTRHEYVHYLSGRFLIEGGFNELELYENNRLTWFDEGFAEFLAGSTWCGVETRAVLVGQLAADTQSMTVEQVVHASYASGFKFYRYAALFIEFLLAGEGNQEQELSALFAAIRQSDSGGYDAIVSGWVGLDAEYQEFLVELTESAEEDWPMIPFVGEIQDPASAWQASCTPPAVGSGSGPRRSPVDRVPTVMTPRRTHGTR